MATDRCLVLFTKPPIPGHVKTRLIGELTADQAARLHAAFLGDLVDTLLEGAFDLRIAWAAAPATPLPAWRAPGFRQQGADLGERLHHGLGLAAAGHAAVAAVGSDHPDLPVSLVESAFDRVAGGRPVVLGPAEDGGYYLIALDSAVLTPALFEGISWSTPRVLEQTLERCRALGLEPALLPTWSDVDQPADLDRVTAAIAAGAGSCPRTRRLLASWGRL